MPLPPRILAALLAAAHRLDGAGVEWLVAGGAGRALQGAHARPRDLDLEVEPGRAADAAAALGLELADDADHHVRSRRAVGTLAGVEVDLTTRLAVRGDGGGLEPDWEMQRRWARTVTVAGRAIATAPTEETLARALVRGDWARLAKVAAGGGPAPRAAYLAERLSSMSPSATE